MVANGSKLRQISPHQTIRIRIRFRHNFVNALEAIDTSHTSCRQRNSGTSEDTPSSLVSIINRSKLVMTESDFVCQHDKHLRNEKWWRRRFVIKGKMRFSLAHHNRLIWFASAWYTAQKNSK